MFSEIYTTKEKPIIKVLPIKRNPKCWRNNLLSMPIIQVFDLIDELTQLYIIMSWSTVNPKLFKSGPAVAISWASCFWSTHQALDGFLIRMRLYCRLLGETVSVSKTKTKKNWKKNSLESASDETSVRTNRPLIRLVCARIGLWSDKFALKIASGQTVLDRRDLWSDKIQTIVQAKLRSRSSPDHVMKKMKISIKILEFWSMHFLSMTVN